MLHYAELGVDNIVKRVLYIDTVKCMTNGGIEKEEIGREYLETQHGGTWMKCSFNTYGNVHNEGGTPFRANYPGVGDYYNSTNDIFYAPRPTDMNGQVLHIVDIKHYHRSLDSTNHKTNTYQRSKC